MKIIDLTLPLTHRMLVYPGDPEVNIVEVHTLPKQGWNLRTLGLATHLGTHVNAPYHMVEKGKKLDEYQLDYFIGKAILFSADAHWDKETGLIFSSENITPAIYEQLIKNPPKFIGLSNQFEFDIDLERKSLEKGIISFENLAHTKKLPEKFTFYGIPLNIPGADGSPVRAFAVI